MIEHIQINDVAPRIHYDADGVQSAFTYPFAIFKASDLEVWLGEIRQNSGFTVSGAGISSGGTVLFAAPPPAGNRVTLHRRLTLERVSDYQADGIIRAKTLNDEFDYQVAALQQVAEDVGRALKLAPTSSSPVDLTLPEPAAGRGLKWNPSGSALVNSDHDPDTVGNVLQALADAQAAAQAAGTARDQTLAAVGSVKVSANDSVQGPLVTKLMAGSGITVTESGDGADERLVIASTVVVPQSVTDRLTFLERNLALTVLRDQIDTGWSVLKMVDGIADEFEDETGIDTAGSTGKSYDATGDFYCNVLPVVSVVPLLTSNTSSGSLSANSEYSSAYAAWKAADANAGTWWHSAGTGVSYWDYTLTASAAVNGYSITPSDAKTYSWKFEAWNGASWVTLDTRSGVTFAAGVTQIFSFVNATAYGRYRVYFTAVGGDGYTRILAFEFLSTGTAADMVLTSQVYTAAAQPEIARLVLLHQPMASVTLNTDVIAEISRNGGTNWAAASLSDQGAFDTVTRVLAATADLSAQPAGAAMTWRLRTLNNKEQRLHGVWLQWR